MHEHYEETVPDQLERVIKSSGKHAFMPYVRRSNAEHKSAAIGGDNDNSITNDDSVSVNDEKSDDVESEPMLWGEVLVTYHVPIKREMDEVLEFIKKNGDCASGRWEKLKCGCSAFIIDWSKPADRLGLTRIPSLYAPCCGLAMLRTELQGFGLDATQSIADEVTTNGNTVEALVQRHMIDCPMYNSCAEHLY